MSFTVAIIFRGVFFVFPSVCRSGPVRALFLFVLTLSLADLVTTAQAQTAPQLLPYTAKVVAGGGATAATAGSTCTRNATTTPSGNVSSDAYGDNCLATEIVLTSGSGPRYAVADGSGAIYFSDYANGLIRRVDPTTGVVSLIAGGASANAAAGAACTGDANHSVLTADALGDGCLGTSVKLGKPTGLAFNPITGDLYFADYGNYDVRRMSFSNGGIATVIVNSAGSGYTSAPTVTISAPASGVQATATATVANGVITGITITNPGSGYSASAMPTVTIGASNTGVVATGTAVYTGVVTMAVGNYNGGSSSSTSYGFNAGCNTTLAPGTAFVSGGPCVVRTVYSIAFDPSGDLLISDEYYYAVLALNTTSVATKVLGKTLQPNILTLVIGSGSGGAACVNGSASSSGCYDAVYTSGAAATSTYLYSPYGVASDTSGDVFVNDEYYYNVAEASASTTDLTSFAGATPLVHTAKTELQSERAPAGTFGIGVDYGVGVDTNNNVYISDSTSSFVWRVDEPSNSMYVLAGGGAGTTTGSKCGATGIAANLTATDAFGDGCPGLDAKFNTYIFGVNPDKNGNVLVGDVDNAIVREIATGAQFGTTGASATDYIDVHFASGDAPSATTPYVASTTTGGTNIFAVGAATCTTNSDGTTDCVLPVTATPTKAGAYTGTLTVTSTKFPNGTVTFPLSGYFAKSPNTGVAITFASTTTSCGAGTTFSTTDTVAITAALIANGPVPSGTITFFAAVNGGTAMQIGTPQTVTNIGTSSAPVYGAVLDYSFSTAGSYTISATYSGDTTKPTYFLGSTGTSATPLVSTTPTFSLIPSANMQSTVTAGQTALYSFTSSQSVYTGTITYSVTGLPANASATFSPSSVTTTGCSQTSTIALSVLTTAATPTVPAGMMSGRGPWAWMSFAAVIGLALLIGLRRSRLGQVMMAVLVLIATTGLVACNGTHVNAPPATPTGTYTLTVTGTGSTGVVSSTTLPLVVQ